MSWWRSVIVPSLIGAGVLGYYLIRDHTFGSRGVLPGTRRLPNRLPTTAGVMYCHSEARGVHGVQGTAAGPGVAAGPRRLHPA